MTRWDWDGILKINKKIINKKRDRRRKTSKSREKKREELGLAKRQAFFAAKSSGKDGDAAMKSFMEQEREIDAESEEDILPDAEIS